MRDPRSIVQSSDPRFAKQNPRMVRIRTLRITYIVVNERWSATAEYWSVTAQWWSGITTADQCGQNTTCVCYIESMPHCKLAVSHSHTF